MTGQAKDAKAGAKARLDWVDAAKGLGIILVVIGHVWTRGAVRDAIYAFHMPLFFILAGYFAQPRPMKECALRQWRSMALPYMAFLLTGMLADQAIEHLRGVLPLFRDWGSALRALLLGGTELTGPFTIFWFVPCLAAARLIYNAISCLWPDPRDGKTAAAMAAMLAFGLWIGAQSDFSPLGLLTVPVAVVLLWLGALWRTVERDGALLLAGLAVSLVALAAVAPVPINMKLGDYGVPGLSLLLAVAMSLGLCLIARLLSGVALLTFLGRRSMTIMFCHVAVIHYLSPYFGKMTLLPLALLLPLAVHEGLARTAWGRRFFLGQGERKQAGRAISESKR
ncbi:MAG: acyltransferase family protein [Sphingobium sp.]